MVLRDYVEEAVEVEFVEKETEAVVGEGGCYYEFYQQVVELEGNCLDMQVDNAIYMEVVLWLMK